MSTQRVATTHNDESIRATSRKPSISSVASSARSYSSDERHDQDLTQNENRIASDNQSTSWSRRWSVETNPGQTRSLPKRGIGWQTPIKASSLFLLGLACAIGHHVFLSGLDGRPADNQTWIGRYSLGLAFIVKTALVLSAEVAFTQQAWQSLRHNQRGISIRAVDALFNAPNTGMSFLCWDMWRSSLIATLIATLTWIIPLSAIFSPNTLTVNTSLLFSSTMQSVPTLNFSLSLISETLTTRPANFLDLTSFDEEGYVPSYTTSKIASLTGFSGSQLGWPSPCGPNCSYHSSFTAPSWQCQSLQNPFDPRTPWSPSYTWGTNDINANLTGIPIFGNKFIADFDNHTGQFWIGNRIQTNQTAQTFSQTFNLTVFSCSLRNTTYYLNVNYTNSQQHTAIEKLVPLDEVNIPSGLVNHPVNLTGKILQDPSFLNMLEVHKALANLMRGSVIADPMGLPLVNTSVYNLPGLVTLNHQYLKGEGLGTDLPFTLVRDLLPAVEQLSHNFSISFLSQPDLLIVNSTSTACTTWKSESVWHYSPGALIGSYSAAIITTFLSLLVGARALRANGIATSSSFASFLTTTRNSTLDKLVEGHSLGQTPLSKRLQRTRLRLGELPGADKGTKTHHAALGLPDEVIPIQNEKVYI